MQTIEGGARISWLGSAASPVAPCAPPDVYNHMDQSEHMSRLEIKEYALGWFPQSNRAIVTVKLEDGSSKKIKVDSPGELAALAAVLKERPVFLYDTGLIATGWEDVGPET